MVTRFFNKASLLDTFAPPTTAPRGRRGFANAAFNAVSSAANDWPAAGINLARHQSMHAPGVHKKKHHQHKYLQVRQAFWQTLIISFLLWIKPQIFHHQNVTVGNAATASTPPAPITSVSTPTGCPSNFAIQSATGWMLKSGTIYFGRPKCVKMMILARAATNACGQA